MLTAAPHRIELNLRTLRQLFNSMDPSPFHDKDLDADADEFIASWAAEYPLKAPVTLRVHLEEWPAEDPTKLIHVAIQHHFENRARIVDLEFRRLLRDGRASLAIGLLFLAVCYLGIRFTATNKSAWAGYVAEGFTIAGWVAMWRPMQIYLYDWWPIRRKRQNFERLAQMSVEVTHKPRA